MIVETISQYGHQRGLVVPPAKYLGSREALQELREKNLTRFQPIEHKTRGAIITDEELNALFELASRLPEAEQKYFTDYI